MKIAILGTRGIPNNYGGFEQCAEHLSLNLVSKGYEVTVYSIHSHPYSNIHYKGVKIIKKWCPEKKIGSAAHFIYDFLCLKDALKRNFDVIFELGYQSAAISYKLLPIKKSIIVTNMDGLEWKRAKWSPFVQKLTKLFEKIAVKESTALISDNKGVYNYYKQKYNMHSEMIPYAAEKANPNSEDLCHYNVDPQAYFLLIARLEPENNIEMILDGFIKNNVDIPFLVIGNTGTKYGRFLKNKYHDYNIVFLGRIFIKSHLDSLRKNSMAYFHGHSVGGTNPALLEAMAAGAFIIAHDNVFNRDVLNKNAYFFKNSIDVNNVLNKLVNNELSKSEKIKENYIALEKKYSHEQITNQYIKLIEKLRA